MPSIRLICAGEFSWDFLIYLGRLYQKKGLSVVISDYSKSLKLKNYLPKNMNSNIIDDRGLTFLLEASRELHGYLEAFEVQIIIISADKIKDISLKESDYIFIGSNQSYESMMNHHQIAKEITALDLDYVEVIWDYLPSRIQKKYFEHIRLNKITKRPLKTYTLELTEMILKQRLYLQHKPKKSLPKLPKAYLNCYQDILEETHGINHKLFKKLYKKARRRF